MLNHKKEKVKCRRCGKSTGKIKFFVIADDLENPKPYHKKCIDELYFEVMIKLSDIGGIYEEN